MARRKRLFSKDLSASTAIRIAPQASVYGTKGPSEFPIVTNDDSSLVRTAGRSNPWMWPQLDYTIQLSEVRSVDLTALAEDAFTLQAVEGIDRSSSQAKLPSGCRTSVGSTYAARFSWESVEVVLWNDRVAGKIENAAAKVNIGRAIADLAGEFQ